MRNTAPECKPFFSLLTASLAVIAEMLSAGWLTFALFGGVKTAAFVERIPWVFVLLAGSVLFSANHLLLQKSRPLLLILFLDLLFAACGGCAVCAASGAATQQIIPMATVLLATAFFLMECFSLRWTVGRFDEKNLVLHLQILLLLAIFHIWMANQLAVESQWKALPMTAAMLVLSGVVCLKCSGIRSEEHKKGRRKHLTSLLVGLSVLAFGLAGAWASALAGTAGGFAAAVMNKAGSLLRWMMTGGAAVLRVLFARNAIRVDSVPTEEVTGSGGTEPSASGIHGDIEWTRYLIYGMLILLLAFLLVVLIRFLIRTVMGIHVSVGKVLQSEKEENIDIQNHLLALLKEWKQRIRAAVILRRHRSSVAALLVMLEKKCRQSNSLRRKPEETMRSFLLRLAEAREEEECMKEVEALRRLADAADRACYSRDKDWLTEFPEAEILQKLDL